MADCILIGNSGSRNTLETVLYQSNNPNGTSVNVNDIINLTQSYTDFELICIEWGYSASYTYIGVSNLFRSEFLADIQNLNEGKSWNLVEVFMAGYSTIGLAFAFTATNQIKITEKLGSVSSHYIRRIVGL